MAQTSTITRNYKIGETFFDAPQLANALYLVPTPIGNLRDISLRALEVLAGVDIVACEDTRVTRILLDFYAIKQKLIAYHDHNSERAGVNLLTALQAGKSMALVSDAGMPLISDPGFDLVRLARQAGIPIVPLPGASALLTALVAAGLPCQSFLFDGFLPTKFSARRARLKQLQEVEQTLIFYESPHRVAKTLTDMVAIFGAHRLACLCRELTKYYETIDTGTIGSLAQKYGAENKIRGEIVLLIDGVKSVEPCLFSPQDLDAMLIQAATTLSTSGAAKEVAARTGEKKETLYQRLLFLRKEQKADEI